MAAEVKEVFLAVPKAEGRNFPVLLLLPEPDSYLWLLTWRACAYRESGTGRPRTKGSAGGSPGLMAAGRQNCCLLARAVGPQCQPFSAKLERFLETTSQFEFLFFFFFF